MHIIYRHAHLVGIRYSFSWLRIFFSLILLGAFFFVTAAFACGRMNWSNWLTASAFICGILGLVMSIRKAVFNRKTRKLMVYDNWFGLTAVTYSLPAHEKDIRPYTNQRIEYAGRNHERLVLTDLLVRLPEGVVVLDTFPVGEARKGAMRKDWDRFFAVVYDPYPGECPRSGHAFRYRTMALWILLVLSGIVACYLNFSGKGMLLREILQRW